MLYIWNILNTYKEQFIVIHLEEGELFHLEVQHIQYHGEFFSVLQWYQSKPRW